jgi:hypothetical protein
MCPVNYSKQVALSLEPTARGENDKTPERLGRIILKKRVRATS